MLTEWERDFVLRFTCDGQPIRDLMVHFRLLSNKKNDFPIGPFLTDKNGKVQIALDAMAAVIEAEKGEFPMDYDGSVADCRGVEIRVESKAGLRERVDRLQEFYPHEAANLRSLVAKSSNQRFEPVCITIETPPHGMVTVVLKRVDEQE